MFKNEHLTMPAPDGCEHLVTPEALHFVATLSREFDDIIDYLLDGRRDRHRQISRGVLPDFRPETAWIRNGDWKAGLIPDDLLRRRVEITGPASVRDKFINALNSGAEVYMTDSEDSEAPTWKNILNGQKNVFDAVRRTISYDSATKSYRLKDKTAVLMFRPRGLHLPEKHFLVDDSPVRATVFDLGMFVCHNAKMQLDGGNTPAIYMPKMESYFDAKLLNDLLNRAETLAGLPKNSIKVTVLIETLPAAFEMEEIIYELRGRIVGLNCGRWDYIFSFIKTFSAWPDRVLPDRSTITMNKDFLAAYSKLLVKICHKRGVYAMGGMAAQVPSKNDPEMNLRAENKQVEDKEREAQAGHDGTWVAHPASVPVAQRSFDKYMKGPNQLHVMREDVVVVAADLLKLPVGERTEEGLRLNIRICIQYMEAWFRAQGCVALMSMMMNMMEDAATAEISRAQTWHWRKHKAKLNDGREINDELIGHIVSEEVDKLSGDRLAEATELFMSMLVAEEMPEFMTIPAYDKLLELEKAGLV